MRKTPRWLPSPSMAVAMVALVVAMGGTTWAAITLPRNSVKSSQIARNAVGSSEIRKSAAGSSEIKKNAVHASELADNAVDSAAVFNNSLKGDDVDESSFGTVPISKTTDQIEKIAFRAVNGQVGVTVFEGGGLKLVAGCATNTLTVTATTATDDARISIGSIHSAADPDDVVKSTDNNFDKVDTFNVLPAFSNNITAGTLVYVQSTGAVVTITFTADEFSPLPNLNCVFAGNAIVSA